MGNVQVVSLGWNVERRLLAHGRGHVRSLFVRFVWAVVAFVLATVLIGAGIAQRTIFMGPSEIQMELTVDDPEPYVLVDS